MKKSFLFILVILSLSFVSRAQVSISDIPLSDDFNTYGVARTTVVGEIVGEFDNEVVTVVHPENAMGISKDFEVQTIGKNGEMHSVRLKGTRQDGLVAATITDDVLHMLLAKITRSQFTVSRVSVSLLDMEVITPFTPVYSEKTEVTDTAFYWVGKSPDGDFVGLVCGAFHKSPEGFQGYAMMFNNDLDTLWTRKYTRGNPKDLKVDNEGEMLVMSYKTDFETGRTNFRFGVFDEEGVEEQEAQLDDGNLLTVKMLNYINGKFVLMGLPLSHQDKYGNMHYAAISGLVYDMDKQLLTQSLHFFTKDEANVLENRSLDYPREGRIVANNLQPMSTTATVYGGAVALARLYFDVRGMSTPSFYFYTTGALVAAIDTNGDFLWCRPFRNYVTTTSTRQYMRYGLCAQGDNVCLLLSENSECGSAYDISTPAPVKVLGAFKVRTAVYTITPQGEVSKDLFGEVTKQRVTTDLMPDGKGNYWFLTSLEKQASIHKLNTSIGR